MVSRTKRVIHGITSRKEKAAERRRTAELLAVGADAVALADRLNTLTPGVLETVPARSDEATDHPRNVLVVMSQITYRDLFERAEDAAAKAAFERARGEERVPIEIVKRLVAREHPVRVWREHRGLTLEQLGVKAGLSIGYLSEIESGKKPGSIKALRVIARALKLDLDDITGWLK
jgi:hypothetical protein